MVNVSGKDANLYYGATLKASSGVHWGNVTGLRVPLAVGVSLSVIEAVEKDGDLVSAHADWDILAYERLFGIDGPDSNRFSTSYSVGISVTKNIHLGFRTGIFGEWGKAGGSGSTPSGYQGVGEYMGAGVSGSENYWALGFLAGLRVDVMPFKPDVPVAIFLESDGNLGGGQKDGEGTFYGGVRGLLGLQVAFY
jgi:hypothetical protein